MKWRRILKSLSMAVATSTLVLTALVLSPQPAAASSRVYYITFNLAGASSNATYTGGTGQTPAVNALYRLQAVNSLLDYIDVLRPQGVAVQELCDSTSSGQTDAYEYLASEAFSRGYVLYSQETKVLSSLNCRQRTGVLSVDAPTNTLNYRILPYDGHETRIAVCNEAFGFVKVTNCSTHLHNKETNQTAQEDADEREAQSTSARGFTRDFDTNDLDSLGGDFNADVDGSLAGPTFTNWYSQYSEGDRFVGADTNGSRKLDYYFGRLAFMQSVSGAQVVSTGHSDHKLLWAPYDWL